MNKKVNWIILVCVVCIIAGVILLMQYQRQIPASGSNNPSKTINQVKVPTNIFSAGDLKSFQDNNSLSFSNKLNASTVAFVGTNNQSRNPGSSVVVNGERVGTVDGIGILNPTFSQDGKYFAFVSVAVCGAGCQDFKLGFVDVAARKVMNLTPQVSADTRSFPVIESYSWGKDVGVIDFTSYIAEADDNASTGYVRISPRQIWEYNESSSRYTLIQALAE